MNDSISILEQLVTAIEQAGVNVAPTYQEYMPLAFAIANSCGEEGRTRFHRICRISEKYHHDEADKPDNTFDIKRIIFMAHGKITKRWTCDFMYDFYNGGMLLEVYTDYQFLPGLTARIGEFKVPYTIENELSPTTVELINCYSQSVCYLAGVSGSDKCYGMTSGRDIGMMLHGKLFRDFLQYKVAVMNGQGLNTKDKNSQKDVVGNLMVNPLKWLSVGGSFIHS